MPGIPERTWPWVGLVAGRAALFLCSTCWPFSKDQIQSDDHLQEHLLYVRNLTFMGPFACHSKLWGGRLRSHSAGEETETQSTNLAQGSRQVCSWDTVSQGLPGL